LLDSAELCQLRLEVVIAGLDLESSVTEVNNGYLEATADGVCSIGSRRDLLKVDLVPLYVELVEQCFGAAAVAAPVCSVHGYFCGVSGSCFTHNPNLLLVDWMWVVRSLAACAEAVRHVPPALSAGCLLNGLVCLRIVTYH